jgi:hypothetical protein
VTGVQTCALPICHKARSTIRKSPGCCVTSLAPQVGNPIAGVPQTSSGHIICTSLVGMLRALWAVADGERI